MTTIFDKGRDLEATRSALAAWLSDKIRTPVDVIGLDYPVGAGTSNETILFTARLANGTAHDLVLRVEPRPEFQLFLDPGLRTQFDLLDALSRHTAVRVPAVHWFEEDPAVLGQPFFIMEQLHGRVPVSHPGYNVTGWLFDALPAQRSRAWESAVRQLAAIHSVPRDAVALLDRPALGPTGLEQDLAYWDRMLSWAIAGHTPDHLDAVRDWLFATVPDRRHEGLAWGDARIGNMMFGDDFEVVGVMDWEQASLAGGMTDVGWWLFFDVFHSDALGVARLDGLGTREETIDLWRDHTGLEVHDLHWYEVLAGFKLSILAIRATEVLSNGRKADPRQKYAMLALTCRLLDMDPSGLS